MTAKARKVIAKKIRKVKPVLWLESDDVGRALAPAIQKLFAPALRAALDEGVSTLIDGDWKAPPIRFDVMLSGLGEFQNEGPEYSVDFGKVIEEWITWTHDAEEDKEADARMHAMAAELRRLADMAEQSCAP